MQTLIRLGDEGRVYMKDRLPGHYCVLLYVFAHVGECGSGRRGLGDRCKSCSDVVKVLAHELLEPCGLT